MTELLVFAPAAAGVIADRVSTFLFKYRHRRGWRGGAGNVAVLAGVLAEKAAEDLNIPLQAEIQVTNISTFRNVPEKIVSGKLAWLKALAGLAALTAAGVNFKNKNFSETFTCTSIALPFLVGAVLDGLYAQEALDPEIVLNLDLPAWRWFKKIL